MGIGAIIGGLIKPISDIIGKAVKDKDKAAQLTHDIEQSLIEQSDSIINASRDIIVAEATGESAAQRNWRPHLMYFLMIVIAFNAFVVPIVELFTGVRMPVADILSALPDQLWTLLTVGMGGYITGRSIEKTAKNWKQSK